MLELIRTYVLGGSPMEVIRECRNCGMELESGASSCANCGSGNVARYEIE
jgi:ribosomal protein L37E